MIYFYCGDDVLGSKAKMDQTVDALIRKNPEASIFRIESETFSEEQFEELIISQTLFYQKYVVVVDRLGANPVAVNYIRDHLELLVNSQNIFFFFEAETEGELALLLRPLAKKEIKTNLETNPEIKGFNVFSIVDAFSSKRRQDLWVVFQQALMAGVDPEEVLWKLEWSIKNLLLVKRSTNSKDSGLAPFPLKKAMRDAKNFSEEELVKLHGGLVDLYHQTRFESKDLQVELERFILGV